MEEMDTTDSKGCPPVSDEVAQYLPEIQTQIPTSHSVTLGDIIPTQMTKQEMLDLVMNVGENPIDVCIKKYEMFKEWCIYQFTHDYYKIKYDRLIGTSTCALCHTNCDCDDCILSKIGHMCCPDKCVISPWYRVQIECDRTDNTEESRQSLLAAIDNMINVLKEAKDADRS